MWTERLALPRLPLCQVLCLLVLDTVRSFQPTPGWGWPTIRWSGATKRCALRCKALCFAVCFAELSAAIIICVIIVWIQLSHMQLMHLIWPYPASLHSARLWWRWILHQEHSGNQKKPCETVTCAFYPFSLHSTVHCEDVNFVGPGAGQSNVQSSEKVTSNDSKILVTTVTSNHFLIA